MSLNVGPVPTPDPPASIPLGVLNPRVRPRTGPVGMSESHVPLGPPARSLRHSRVVWPWAPQRWHVPRFSPPVVRARPTAFAASVIWSTVAPVPNPPVFSRRSAAASERDIPERPPRLILGAAKDFSTSALLPVHLCCSTPMRSVHTLFVWRAVEARMRFVDAWGR